MRFLVVDTSVAVKWFRGRDSEPNADPAAALLDAHLEGRILLVAPDLLLYELGSALARASEVADREKEAAVVAAGALGLRLLPAAAAAPAAAMRIALRDGLTFYDACFVALAEALDVELVTADRRLARATSYPKVLLLQDT